jgi:NAD+ synthase (glutamine-hydrolysing)
MRILLAQMNPIVGDISGNTRKIVEALQKGRELKADLVLFSELCITGYPPEDFLLMPHFIETAHRALQDIIAASQGLVVIVGLPRQNPGIGEKKLLNSAAIIENQTLLGFQDKALLPTYDVFDEKRYFEPGNRPRLWEFGGLKIAVTICEDLWQHSEQLKFTTYARDPVLELHALAPDLVLNLSASPFSNQKPRNRIQVCARAAQTLHCPILMCNQVGGNDSLIFDGYSCYVSQEGFLLDLAKGFEEDFLVVDTAQKMLPHEMTSDPIEDFYRALVLGLRDYFHKLGFQKACLGLSGGIDSALVACLAAEALGPQNVLGVSLPSRYTSESSISDAIQLARRLGIEYREIPIEQPFECFLDLLQPIFEGRAPDVTEENLQARIRGVLLMALSNKFGYIILSTGNKSELAMGYATLYGDMCGGLGVINDVTKMQVYELAKWINRSSPLIPNSILLKAPSAELRLNQKDTDSLPDYEIVDNVLMDYVEEHLTPEAIAKKYGYPEELVKDLVRRIHCNEYKRRQSPPGLRVSEKAFSIGRHFPIVQRFVV